MFDYANYGATAIFERKGRKLYPPAWLLSRGIGNNLGMDFTRF